MEPMIHETNNLIDLIVGGGLKVLAIGFIVIAYFLYRKMTSGTPSKPPKSKSKEDD